MGISAEQIAANLDKVNGRIARACEECGRSPDEVTLVAVSKKKPPEDLVAAADAGAIDIGENYVQEMIAKQDVVLEQKPDLRWHFIGYLQRNKVKYLKGRIDFLHSVGSRSLIKELNKRWPEETPLPVCIQVNIGLEETKSGVSPAEVTELAKAANESQKLILKGLMALPPFEEDPELSRPYFRAVRQARDELEQELSLELPVLSMGMSHDLEVAIQEGATMVRIGTDVFGPR